MKRYLIAMLFPAILIGCASSAPSEDQGNTPAITDNTTLSSYSWQLQDARNANGRLITPLFVQSDKPVQLNLNNGHFNVSNTCNSMGGTYSLHENQMTFGPMVSTRKMCVDSKIAALDYEVSNRLKGINTYSITQGNSPILMLTTANGDILKFSGIATPETVYGNKGEILFLEVGAQKKPCSHPLMPNQQCLQVREIYYDAQSIKSGTGQWENFYEEIQGYEFQPGIRNVLRVKRYKVDNPPADASNTAYVLDMVVESEVIKPKSRSRTRR